MQTTEIWSKMRNMHISSGLMGLTQDYQGSFTLFHISRMVLMMITETDESREDVLNENICCYVVLSLLLLTWKIQFLHETCYYFLDMHNQSMVHPEDQHFSNETSVGIYQFTTR